MTNRTIAIVQARMGSTRFPGKMLAPFHGVPLLHWVLTRIGRSRRLDGCVLATSTLARDTPLADMATGLGVEVFRGDEQDVLGRFVAAARVSRATRVVRICGDRVFVAPELIDRVVDSFDASAPDLAFNHVPDLGVDHPYGMGAEVIAADLLERIHASSDDPMDREHVTWHVWRNRARFTIVSAPCPPEWQAPGKGMRFDVDTPEDLADLEALSLGLDVTASAADLVRRRLARPRLAI